MTDDVGARSRSPNNCPALDSQDSLTEQEWTIRLAEASHALAKADADGTNEHRGFHSHPLDHPVGQRADDHCPRSRQATNPCVVELRCVVVVVLYERGGIDTIGSIYSVQ